MVGEVLPFRKLDPETFVLPMTRDGTLVTGSSPKIDAYPGLAAWIRNAEALWNQHSSGNLPLAEQLAYMGKLTQQVPISSQRVVYSKSGMHVVAALLGWRFAISTAPGSGKSARRAMESYRRLRRSSAGRPAFDALVHSVPQADPPKKRLDRNSRGGKTPA